MKKQHRQALKRLYQKAQNDTLSEQDVRALLIDLACSPLEKQVLAAIDAASPNALTTRQLAEQFERDMTNIGAIVKALADFGLIERQEARDYHGKFYYLSSPLEAKNAL